MKVATSHYKISTLIIPLRDEILLIPIQDITFITSDGSYSLIYKADLSSHTICKSLKNLQVTLLDHGFIRCQRNMLINPIHLSKIKLGQLPQITLSNGQEIPLTKQGKRNLLEAMQSLNKFLK